MRGERRREGEGGGDNHKAFTTFHVENCRNWYKKGALARICLQVKESMRLEIGDP